MGKKIIKITESQLEDIVKKVLIEQGNMFGTAGAGMKSPFMDWKSYSKSRMEPWSKNINPKGLKKGMGGNKDPKNVEAVKKLQAELIRLGFLDLTTGPTGYFGGLTQKALDRYNSGETSKVGSKTAGKLGGKSGGALDGMSGGNKPSTDGPQCIALTTEECAKISSSKETQVSFNKNETRCSAYMVKCLSQYNEFLKPGNAWNVFNSAKGNGDVKYNVYGDGSVNWDNIYAQLKQNKINKTVCNGYAKQDDADKIQSSKLPSIITDSMPQSSKVSLDSLKLGDIVGLYHKASSNKGMAFCQNALAKGLDENGDLNKTPFTFNSHIGFVGAIKNGVPIIIHNVHGSHMATPATMMLNKNSEDMIVWVISDRDVASSIAGKPRGYWEKYTSNVASNLVSKLDSANPFKNNTNP
jgi:peptidoglycan hydrolase-like protein with peptidoglycan-binding domain